MINVLALPLEEGLQRLEGEGYACTYKVLLPPRAKLEDYDNQVVRKYIVRQQMLSDKEVELTVVFR